jgi:hypothetical protein
MEAEEPPRPARRGAMLGTLREGQRLRITGLSLADPAAAAGQPQVTAWVEVVGHQARVIGTLSSKHPIAPATAPVLELSDGDGEFVLCHDSASSSVRLYGHYVEPSDSDGEGGMLTRRRTQFAVDIGVEAMVDDDEEEVWEVYEADGRGDHNGGDGYEPLTEEEIAERYEYGSDNGEYDEDDGNEEEEEVREEYEPLTEEDGRDHGGGVEGEEAVMEYEFLEPLSEEDIAERYDSDNGEYDDDDDGDEEEEDQPRPRKASDGETSKIRWDDMAFVAAPAGLVVPDGVLLGPARFAAVKNTAGFMRIAAAEATTGSHNEGGREIVVLYRYTRFSRTWSGRRGVEKCRRTKLHCLRFAVPPAGNMAGSLAWAGASLSPLIYPRLFRRELRDLWSNLAVAAAIPPEAARVQVIVDVGILRREDHTAERMEDMRGALEATMGEPWPEYYHVVMELHLPEPVRRHEDNYDGGDEDDGAPPAAKRRRIIMAEEVDECSLCLDPLESGLAAWPGCGHVFHGECVQETLAGRETCPLCRHLLSDALHCYC